MYFETIQQFAKMLRALSSILDKASTYAENRKFDSSNYLSARLSPDMWPLVKQVQQTCDVAKHTAARLTGKEAPKHEDNEKTNGELKQRISKCVEYLGSLTAEEYAGAATRQITLTFLPNQYILGQDYLIEFAVPNFYFHMTTAYALLRSAGVEVGKMDYITSLKTHNK
jgi:hypothetical protein